mmetsp:Transcript_10932/g.23088  ORF Transcript_10932/g.23088 Transcript_10932/m.23088 type:complete len:222 (+) Transcript_10932:1317-1982(+)
MAWMKRSDSNSKRSCHVRTRPGRVSTCCMRAKQSTDSNLGTKPTCCGLGGGIYLVNLASTTLRVSTTFDVLSWNTWSRSKQRHMRRACLMSHVLTLNMLCGLSSQTRSHCVPSLPLLLPPNSSPNSIKPSSNYRAMASAKALTIDPLTGLWDPTVSAATGHLQLSRVPRMASVAVTVVWDLVRRCGRPEPSCSHRRPQAYSCHRQRLVPSGAKASLDRPPS